MATVHCKACGKSYSYEENGCCPSCGAYNRPPRRETVEADGTVHHLDDRYHPAEPPPLWKIEGFAGAHHERRRAVPAHAVPHRAGKR